MSTMEEKAENYYQQVYSVHSNANPEKFGPLLLQNILSGYTNLLQKELMDLGFQIMTRSYNDEAGTQPRCNYHNFSVQEE